MNLFKHIKNKDDAKARFNALAKIYHPDAGTEPDGELFIKITNQYKEHIGYLNNPSKASKQTKKPPKKTRDKQIDKEAVNDIKRSIKLTQKQKKQLLTGATLIFNAFASKLLED